MANLPETDTFDAGVYQLETTDAVVGGVGGKSNAAAINLANRTNYLKKHLDGLLSKSVAGSADVTLTASEANNAILELTGVLTGNIAVIVPASPTRSWIVANNTSGDYTLTVKNSGGTGVVCARDSDVVVWTNGTNVYAVSDILAHETAVDPHGAALPLGALDYPTIDNAVNKITVTPAAAAAGGRVSIAANTLISIGKVVTAGETGLMKSVKTPAFTSADLSVSSKYYLRGKFVGDVFTVYTTKGTDSDTIPAGLVGTVDGASGGGFDSTVLDILIAKVVTGVAGSTPTVTSLLNKFKLNLSEFVTATNMASGVDSGTATGSLTINLARTPVVGIGFSKIAIDSPGAVDWDRAIVITAKTRYKIDFTMAIDFIQPSGTNEANITASI